MLRTHLRRFVTIVPILGLLFPTSPLPAQPDPSGGQLPTAVVTASSLNLRAEPSTRAAIVAKAREGDAFPVVAQEGDWLQVRTKEGKACWSMKKYFTIREPAPAQETPLKIAPPPPESAPARPEQEPAHVSRDIHPDGGAAIARFGIIGGFSFAGFSGKDVTGIYERRSGYNAGLLLLVPFGEVVGLQTELRYVMKGAVRQSGGIRSTFAFDYIELPLLLRVAIPASASILPYITAGGSVSYNLQAMLTSDAPGIPAHEITDVAKLDYGIAVGGGAQFTISFLRLLLDARYTIGVPSAQKGPDPMDLKNRCLTVSLGWLF